MTDTALIDQLAAAVAARISPAIPLEFDLWSAAEIAAWLKVGTDQVLERYAPLPDFPKAIRLPTPDGGRGRPRWKAAEVIAWAEKYKDSTGAARNQKHEARGATGNRGRLALRD